MDKNYLYFIEDDIKIIKTNILAFSQTKIDHLFNKIASYGPLEIGILNALLTIVQNQKKNYYQKQDLSRDHTQYKYIIGFTIILLILLISLYYWHLTDNANHAKIQELIATLKPYGITVIEHSKRYYKSTKYWLEIIPTQNLSDCELIKAKKIITQIHNLHANIYSKNKWIFMIIFSGIVYILSKLYSNIRQCLKPQHKEYYKKYTDLEDVIKQRKAMISLIHKTK